MILLKIFVIIINKHNSFLQNIFGLFTDKLIFAIKYVNFKRTWIIDYKAIILDI